MSTAPTRGTMTRRQVLRPTAFAAAGLAIAACAPPSGGVAKRSDSPPDVWNTWGGGVLANFARSGATLDLTGEVEKGGWKDRLVAAPLDMVKVDGKIYAVPVYVSGVFFFYNKELLQSNNLTPPRTWDELLSFIEAAKGKGLIPIGLANKTRWPGAVYLNYLVDRINGGDFLSKALAGQASFTDAGVVEAGRRMQELAKAGAFPEGFNGLDYDTGGSRQLMYAGKVDLELQTSSYPATTGGAADRGGGSGRLSTGPPGGGRRAGRRGHQHRASFRADSIWCTSGGPGTRQRPARRRTQQQAVTRMAGVRSPPPTV